MRRDETLRILREHADELRTQFGVRSLALFGSVARNQAGPKSDVDLLVEFDRRISLFDLVGTAQHIEKLLHLPEDTVNLVLREAVLPELRESIYGEAVDAFGQAPMEVPHPAHP